MQDQATIRRGAAGDLAQASELWRQLVQYNVARDERLPDVAEGGAHKWRQRTENLLKDRAFRLYVAETSGRLVGFVTGFLHYAPDGFERQKVGRVADIFVARDWRRQGVANQLLSALTDWFRREKVSHMELAVIAANLTAVSFWRSVGAREYRARMWIPLDWDSGIAERARDD